MKSPNLVDSCGWLEYFADGANASFFASPIENVDRLVVPTICILEVFKSVFRQRGESAALRAIAAMEQGRVVPLDTPISLSAAKMGVDLGMPLAESVILATARTHKAQIWTQDAHFRKIDGVRYIKAGGRS
ncbi:MAG: type II toxin-antitoxin system VapC family toxin [Deltaproteobacteria bacterium]|nr:type II toxin-antitoxin system VapC family toxin [Deltaproteobacteria bacterium]